MAVYDAIRLSVIMDNSEFTRREIFDRLKMPSRTFYRKVKTGGWTIGEFCRLAGVLQRPIESLLKQHI